MKAVDDGCYYREVDDGCFQGGARKQRVNLRFPGGEAVREQGPKVLGKDPALEAAPAVTTGVLILGGNWLEHPLPVGTLGSIILLFIASVGVNMAVLPLENTPVEGPLWKWKGKGKKKLKKK